MELPNFELLFSLADAIGELSREKGLLTIEIEYDKVKTIRSVTEDDSKRKENGKPLAMNFIEANFGYSGLNDELIPKRMRLVELESELKKKELTLKLLQMQVEVYRTESANNRLIG